MNIEKAPDSELLFYQSENGETRIQVRVHEDTIWMNQKSIAELYQVTVPTINHHLMNIYEDGELAPESTIRKYLIVQTEGRRDVERLVDHYSLEMIIAVGYRVRSKAGTRFRQWATDKIKEYVIKGFTIDDERLKGNRSVDGKDYFDELLERIRDIRASERRFYQKITDIYASCSVDYDNNSEITKEFYATVQNKLHWAIHGHTAAEVIKERADADKPNMGLTTVFGRITNRTLVSSLNFSCKKFS
ncbi:MAG: virulence RhuM family protein [Seleniivibrio sp.]|nr:RhuM family protein [Seleniivibrio sp.]MCD8552727.1 virulence RhuM family protein [Seleniivibrio sp.]